MVLPADIAVERNQFYLKQYVNNQHARHSSVSTEIKFNN